MTVSIAEISKSESASQISQLPTTHQMKTQQLYTGAVRKMQAGLKQRVGTSMIMHGPPRLSVQDQRENKPMPDLPEFKSDKSSLSNSNSTTRPKIGAISGEQPKLHWKAGEKPRSSVPGVNLKQNKVVKETGPIVKKTKKSAVVLAKKNKGEVKEEEKRPGNVMEAERIANKMLRGGNFSTLGNTVPFRA